MTICLKVLDDWLFKMATYNIYPAVDENYNFPPQIRQRIVDYPEIKVTISRMDEAEERLAQNSKTLESAMIDQLTTKETLREIQEETLPQAVAKLEEADAIAKSELSSLDDKLASAKVTLDQNTSDISAFKSVVDSAQDTAKAAQSTADKATQEAADAHNAAVLAEEKARELRADIALGPSVWEDPSFERGKGPIPRLVDGEIERVQENATSGSWSIRYTAPSGINFPKDEDTAPLPIIEGHTYMVSTNVKAEDDVTWTFLVQESRPGQSTKLLLDSESLSSGRWEGVFTAPSPENVTFWCGLSPRSYYGDAVGQRVWIDELRLVDITDTWPKLQAAQKAAEEAKAKAESAYSMAESKISEQEAKTLIKTSMNGKNAITISASNPDSSTPGVAEGDTWWRVDSSGSIFGQWRWDGYRWVPVTIRSEIISSLDVHKLQVTGSSKLAEAVIDKLFAEIFAAKKITAQEIDAKSVAGEVGQFIKVKTDTLIAGESITNEAVINKLWADGIAAKAVTSARFVAASGNIYIDPELNRADAWPSDGVSNHYPVDPDSASTDSEKLISGRTNTIFINSGSSTRTVWEDPDDLYEKTPVEPGVKYKYSIHVQPAARYSIHGWLVRLLVQFYADTEGKTPIGSRLHADSYETTIEQAKDGTVVACEFAAPEDAKSVRIGFELDPNVGVAVMIFRPKLVPMVGSTLIEPGAITTKHITVTDTLAGNIVRAMDSHTKNLVVTESAVIRHAKLIGDTWADKITASKIIGQDGIFKGTVDFNNINVTGTQIANKLSANMIDANVIKSGSFYGRSFTGGSFTGTTFTGGTIQTSESGAKMVMSGTSIRAYDSRDNLTTRMDEDGISYWSGSRAIGNFAMTEWYQKPGVKGVTMWLSDTGDFIAYGYKHRASDIKWDTMLTLDPKGLVHGKGEAIYFSSPIKSPYDSYNKNWPGFEFTAVKDSKGNYIPCIKWGDAKIALTVRNLYFINNQNIIYKVAGP